MSLDRWGARNAHEIRTLLWPPALILSVRRARTGGLKTGNLLSRRTTKVKQEREPVLPVKSADAFSRAVKVERRGCEPERRVKSEGRV